VALFRALNEEQVHRLAGRCTVRTFEPGDTIFAEGKRGEEMYVLLSGTATITMAASGPVGSVHHGECLGEMALLTGAAHSATATAASQVEAAVLGHQDLTELVRLRPDIGLLLYRHLAIGMGQKLRRSGQVRTAPSCALG
jgi:CRP-like cAMP-binding protein